MDKYEYQAKLEEINTLVGKADYDGAAKIADTVEWKRVRSARTLCMVSEIYEAVGRAEDSKAILYRAYRRSPSSRQLLYRLTEACIQTQDFDDAVEYYTEYVNLAPNDNSKYILKYEIYKGRGSSLEEQIGVLEELKSKEYTEQWAYELAKLYDQAGMGDKCVAECDDLALWFHSGKYVVQALELKKKYAQLTPEQQTIYDNPSDIVDMETKEQAVDKVVPILDEIVTKELPKSEKEVIADSIIMDTEKQIAADVQATAPEATEAATEVAATEAAPAPQETAQEKSAEPSPKADKEFNTVELQSELASSMKAILSGVRPAVTPTVELESVPGVVNEAENTHATAETAETKTEETKTTEKTEEVQDPHQMSIDDLLTGAPTIDISKKIQQETGVNGSIRDYLANKGSQETAQVQSTAASVETPIPEVAQPQATTTQNQAVTQEQTTTQEQAEAQVQTEAPEEAEAALDPEAYTKEGLDEKEKTMMGFWGTVRGMNEQINQAVIAVMRSTLTDKTSSRGNVILMGDAGNGRTTLAISMAKIISRCKGQTTARVAKIYAEDFNNKDIAATVNKMAGGVLIIEEAGDLNDNAVAQLSMAMDFKTDGLVLILEDEKRYLQDLLARNSQFAQKFDTTISVPVLTNDELVEFGKYYALQNGCTMDDSAVTALYDNIGVMQSPEQPVAILDVKEIMDKAIKSASGFGIGKIFSSISGKRYDKNDRIILKKKNFKKMK